MSKKDSLIEPFRNKKVQKALRKLIRIWVASPLLALLGMMTERIEIGQARDYVSGMVFLLCVFWLTILVIAGWNFLDAYFGYKAGYK